MYYKLFVLLIAIAVAAVVVPFLLPERDDSQLLGVSDESSLGDSLNIPAPEQLESVVDSRSQREASTNTSGKAMTPTLKTTNTQTNTKQGSDRAESILPYETELPKGDLEAIITTSLGQIRLKLWPEAAPKTVANFYELARQGFYKGVTWHRVIEDFMIQSGDPLSKDDDPSNDGTGGPGYQFEDEINEHKLVRGVLAMANSGPNTNGSQFFIITADATPHLDGKHTAFGEVIEGMEVVDQISKVDKDENDRPLKDVVIESIEVIAKHSSSQAVDQEELDSESGDNITEDSNIKTNSTPEEGGNNLE